MPGISVWGGDEAEKSRIVFFKEFVNFLDQITCTHYERKLVFYHTKHVTYLIHYEAHER